MKTRNLEMFRLEDRVLFEAAAAVEIVDAAEAAHDDPNANVNQGEKQAQDDRDALKNAPPENPADRALHHDGGDAPDDPAHNADVDAQIDKIINGDLPVVDGPEIDPGPGAVIDDLSQVAPDGGEQLFLNDHGETVSTGHELVVINSSVMDADAIIGELAPNQETLRLEAGSDAMEQITDFLNATDTKYDAIHIVTHGNDGYFVLNGEVVDGDSFDAAEWSAVGEHLTADGDILLYGCDLAETEAGQTLCARIADASGADVAASTDATGLHGDWDLEYHHGVIEAAHLTVENYVFDLNTFEVSNLNDSGAGSLRDAILQANSRTGLDDVVFRTDGTIVLGSEIGITDSVNIIGNGVGKTVISGNDASRIFSIDANTDIDVNISNLTLTHGSTADNGGAVYVNLEAGGSVTLDTVAVTASKVTGVGKSGGGVYLGEGNLNILNSTLSGNSAASFGGGGGVGVGNTATNVLNIVNSTLTENTGTLGNAVFIGGGTFNLLDSTVAGKNTPISGNGIYINSGATVNILNSIVTGFTADISGTVTRAAYSVSGTDLTSLGNGNRIGGYADLFNTNELGDNGGPTQTIALANGNYNGVFVWHNDDFSAVAYSSDAAGSDKTAFSGTAAAATAVITADQRGRAFNLPSVGAYALNTPETRSLTVTTAKDIIDPYDGLISLREALLYATTDIGIGSLKVDGKYTITFADSLFGTASSITITLDSALGALTLAKDTFTAANGPLTIDASAAKGSVTIDGGNSGNGAIDGVQIMLINSGNEVTLSHLTFRNGYAGSGGAIYNAGTLSVTDSTFSGNSSFDNGGAIYNLGTLSIANSTFSDNSANIGGGAICNFDGNVYLLNSILVGNTASEGVDVWTWGDADTHIYAYYCLIGDAYDKNGGKTGLAAFDGTVGTQVNVQADAIFDGQDANGLYKIKADGAAADSGTLVGKLGDDFYFKDGDNWVKASDTNTTRRFDFTSADGHYGLGAAATVFAAAQNRDDDGNPVSRVQTLLAFNAGAYALNATKETPSLVVTTDQDIVNPYDGVISLREALLYAAADIGVGDLRVGGKYTVTFADSLFDTVSSITIRLDGTLGALTLAKDTFTAANGALTIDASAAKGTVTIDGGNSGNGATDGVQIMLINSGNEVTLSHLTFQNGYAANGGAIDNAGTLTVEHADFHENSTRLAGGAIYNIGNLAVANSTFSGNSAANGGAILNDGTLSVADSAFSVNSADYGGAICITRSRTATIVNAAFSGNSAIRHGGAIYNTGNLAVTNAAFSGNSATNGGAVWGGTGQTVVANATLVGNRATERGGAFYAKDGLLVIVNSTVTQNIGNDSGSGIYCDSAELAIANSIVWGNTGSEEITVEGDKGFSAVYLVSSAAPSKAPDYSEHNYFDCQDDPFTAKGLQSKVVNGVKQLYFEVTDLPNNPVATGGTKLRSRYGNAGWDIEYYSKDSQQWQTLVNRLKLAPTEDQLLHDQIGQTRMMQDRWLIYSIGAVNMVGEAPSLTVTTADDIVDPYDGVISLREALAYAAADIGVWRLRDNDRYTITFADSLFGTGSVTIKLDGMLGALMLARNTFTEANGPLTIDAAAAKGAVVLDGGYDAVNKTGGVRIMDISPGNVVTLSHLTFQNGCSTQGGAIFNGGTLSITDSIFSGNSSPPPADPPINCYGGAIYNRGTVSITNSAFNGNHANDNGGAIYNEHNGALGALSGAVSITNSTFSGNSANLGGAIYNDQRGTLSVTNSTFSGNSAGNGGAIFNNNDGTVSITDSTFSGNSANLGGAIDSWGGNAYLLNSILAGNTATDGADVWTNGNTYAYYCLIGDAYNSDSGKTGLAAFTDTVGTRVDIQAADIFDGQDTDGLYKIKADGAAADSGTLVGKLGDDFYFKDGDNWRKASDVTEHLAFDFLNKDGHYGLGATATVFTAAQNRDSGGNPVSRVQTLLAFNTGAYALNGMLETPSLAVTAADDILNPYDGVISLREALLYAMTDIGVGNLKVDGRYTITFADSLFGTATAITIKLDSVLGALTLAQDTFTAANGALTIDASAAKGAVTLDGGYDAVNQTGGVQIMNIASGNDVTLSHLTFQHGDSGYGGAIDNDGTLTIVAANFNDNTSVKHGGAIDNDGTLSIADSVFSNNSAASRDGGAIRNSGTLSITNSAFSGNSAGGNGGAIYNSGTLEIANASFTGNRAGDSGGAVYGKGTLTAVNSTFYGNQADDAGGAIYFNGDNKFELTVAGSTLTGNRAGNGGGGIFVLSGAMNLVNDIIVGNVSPTVGTDIESNGAITAIGAAYGNAVGGFVTEWHAYSNVRPEQIFTTDTPLTRVVDGITQSYFEIKDAPGSPVTAAGAKLRVDGGTLQYYDLEKSRWVNLAATALSTDLVQHDQIGRTRLMYDSSSEYSIGAISMFKETPSLVVTTDLDVVNPYDGLISLREAALYYAKSGDTVTFADGITSAGLTLGALTIDRDVTIQAANPVTITQSTPGDTTIFSVTAGNTLTLTGSLAFGGGRITGSGNVTVGAALTGSTATADMSGGTFTYAGSAAQTVLAGTYHDLAFSGSGERNLSGNLNIGGNLVIAGTNNAAYLQVNGNAFQMALAGTLTASYADLSNLNFTSAQTVQSYDAVAATNTVSGSGNTNLRILMTPGSGSTASPLTYGQKLRETTVDLVYSLRGADTTLQFAPDSDLVFDVLRDSDGKVIARTVSGIDAVSGNYVFNNISFSLLVNPRGITVSGIGANDKTYDSGTGATLDYSNVYLNGLLTGDTLGITAIGSFADKNVGANKIVTLSALTLTGSDAGNYVLAVSGQQTTATATITARTITVSGIAADDRIYDGTTDTTLDYTNAMLDGKIANDKLSVSTTGAFADKNVGTNKVVTLSALTLTGDDAGNYVLAGSGQQTTATASITPRTITVDGIGADDKTYDGGTDATLDYSNVALTGKIAGDDLSASAAGSFADKNAGANKIVTLSALTLTGDDAGNYVLAVFGQQTTAAASITPRAITVTADGQTKTAGDADPALTYQLTSGDLADGDAFTGELTRDAGEKIGDYAIRQGTLTAGGNYCLTYVGANLTIVARPVSEFHLYSSGLHPDYASALITDSVRTELKNLLVSFAGKNLKLLGVNSLPAALSFYNYLSDLGDGIEWNNIDFTDLAHDATIQRLFGQVTDYLGLDRNPGTWSPKLIYALDQLNAEVGDLLGINSSAELYEKGNISYGPDYSFGSLTHAEEFQTFSGVRNFKPYQASVDDAPGVTKSDSPFPMAQNSAPRPAEDAISVPSAENADFRYLAPELPRIHPARPAKFADAELQKLLRDFGPAPDYAPLEKSRAFMSEFELLLDALVTA